MDGHGAEHDAIARVARRFSIDAGGVEVAHGVAMDIRPYAIFPRVYRVYRVDGQDDVRQPECRIPWSPSRRQSLVFR